MSVLAALCITAAIIGVPEVQRIRRREQPTAARRVLPVNGGMRIFAAFLLAAAAGALIGGALGVVVAIGTMVMVPRIIGRMSTRADQRADERRLRDAPQVAALLAACLASGATPYAAVRAVAAGFDGPTARGLLEVERALHVGEPVARAFSRLSPAPLGHAIARSAETGAGLVDVLPGIAADLRRQLRSTAEVAARSAGVRAVAPLAVCFLPAFLLLGVVPVVVGLARSVLS